MSQVTNVIFTLAALCITGIEGRGGYASNLPNGENILKFDKPRLGHENNADSPGGMSQFGKDFAAEAFIWTKDLCNKDSDNDGMTNGEELGDPLCKWNKDTNPDVERTTGLYNPSIKDAPKEAPKEEKPTTPVAIDWDNTLPLPEDDGTKPTAPTPPTEGECVGGVVTTTVYVKVTQTVVGSRDQPAGSFSSTGSASGLA
eukprot:Pgem_evm1s7304